MNLVSVPTKPQVERILGKVRKLRADGYVPAPLPDRDPLSSSEVAEFLGISVAELRILVEASRYPALWTNCR
jgi:hypothetical protein